MQEIEAILNRYKSKDETELPTKENALRRAANAGDYQDIIFLLRNGALIDDQAPNTEKTALHWAIKKESYQTVKRLLEYNARYDLEDSNGVLHFVLLLNQIIVKYEP